MKDELCCEWFNYLLYHVLRSYRDYMQFKIVIGLIATNHLTEGKIVLHGAPRTGKSTLLNIISDVLFPDLVKSGRVVVGDVETQENKIIFVATNDMRDDYPNADKDIHIFFGGDALSRPNLIHTFTYIKATKNAKDAILKNCSCWVKERRSKNVN